MKNDFKRIVVFFIGVLILLLAAESIWLCIESNVLTMLILVFLLIAAMTGLMMIKIGLRSA